ncbi:hypothetical protein ScPMuIL_002088, partial [Solemya velum]
GSKSPLSGRISCAYTIPTLKLNKQVRLTDNISVYSAELTAIAITINDILQSHIEKPVLILTDSLSGLQALGNYHANSNDSKITRILTTNTLCKQKNVDVTFFWCPGHSGISGNELADKLVKSGLSHKKVDFNIPHTPNEIKSIVKAKINLKLKNRWKSTPKGLHYKQVISIDKANINQLVRKCRSEDKTISRMIFGKTLLNGEMAKYIRNINSKCPHCDQEETLYHLLLESPKHTP